MVQRKYLSFHLVVTGDSSLSQGQPSMQGIQEHNSFGYIKTALLMFSQDARRTTGRDKTDVRLVIFLIALLKLQLKSTLILFSSVSLPFAVEDTTNLPPSPPPSPAAEHFGPLEQGRVKNIKCV